MRRNFEEEEPNGYPENKLDMAFIAEDSREVRSVSMTASEPDSISVVSHIHSNTNLNSPFLTFDHEISSMEEWPPEKPNIFGKKASRRDSRKSESIIEENEDSNEEEREIEKMSKCTKKRIGEKMKVITVGPSQNSPSVNPYLLRSKKCKLLEGVNNGGNISAESSSDELRQIVDEIDGKSRVRNGGLFTKYGKQG